MGDGKTIRALALESFESPPSVIDVPEPAAGPGEVLVRVRAASINAFDIFVAMGAMKDNMPHEFPAVIGSDLAGVVEAVGEDVEGLASGDRVFGMLGFKGSVHDGTFGELATPQAASLSRIPGGVDDQQAGSLGIAGTTAMSAVDAIAATTGGTVLIVGATGGVGTFAIQLAAAQGAHVIASALPDDEDVIRGLGAVETVDYTNDLPAAIRERHPDGVDGLIDLVNRDPAGFASLAGLVRDGGRATSSVGGAGEATEIGSVAVSNINGNPAHLEALANMIADGKLRAVIRRTYPLADAAQALTDFAQQHTLGKLVITVP